MANLVLNTRKKQIEQLKQAKKDFKQSMKKNGKEITNQQRHIMNTMEIQKYHNPFKTINGYECDENGVLLGIWIVNQRTTYNGHGNRKITEEQIKLLNQVGMKWFSKNIDIKLQKEEINSKFIKKLDIL